VPAAHRLCALLPAPPPCIKGGHHPLILPHHFPLYPRLRALPEASPEPEPRRPPSPSISSAGASTSLPRSPVSSSSLPLPFGALPVEFGARECILACVSEPPASSTVQRRHGPLSRRRPQTPAAAVRMIPVQRPRSTQATESNSSISVNKDRRRQFF
jgi:hypothetical protein